MSYADKIIEAQTKGAYITVNHQLSIHQLNEIHQRENVIYLCHDGKCVDMAMEELQPTDNEEA